MTYTSITPKVAALLEAGLGTRKIAAKLGCDRDTVKRAIAVLEADTNYELERIGFLDIEASNLNASFGIALCFCIKIRGGRTITRSIKPVDIRNGTYDRDLMIQFAKDARTFDRLITWNGARYDIPFLRTRSVLHGIDFPVYGEVHHTDALYMSRHRLRMHSNRLQAVCEFLNIPSKGHKLDPNIWLQCLSGNAKALKWVATHCKEDVESLEQVWERLRKYSQRRNRSM